MLAYCVTFYFVFKVSGNYCHTGARVTGNFIKIGQSLNLLFNLVSNMHFHLLCAGSGPSCGNYHLFYGEVGVFATTKVTVAKDTHNQHKEGEEINKLLVFNGPISPVTIPHLRSPLSIRRTSWLGTSLLSPAVTITSPRVTPLATITSLPA